MRIGGHRTCRLAAAAISACCPMRWTRHGIQRLNAERPAGNLLSASVGDRSGAAPHPGSDRLSTFQALSESVAETEPRLRRLLADFPFGTGLRRARGLWVSKQSPKASLPRCARPVVIVLSKGRLLVGELDDFWLRRSDQTCCIALKSVVNTAFSGARHGAGRWAGALL